MSVDSLRWQKFPVLDDGFVTLVDVMGDDLSVTQAARVSFGNDARVNPDCELCGGSCEVEDPCGGRGGFSGTYPCPNCKPGGTDDKTLIRYLMRHRHTTPFEMAEVKLLVRVPMDCWRQWIRHRTANVNEYSTRYTKAIDSQQKTRPDEWRLQSTNNKQGSSGQFLTVDAPEEAGMSSGECLTSDERYLHEQATRVYNTRLKAGVAKEQARKDLPLSTYTEAYWKCDLHNIFNFLSLRMDSHAQLEIRQYATTIGEKIIKPLFPMCWEAFEEYRLGGMFLTKRDQIAIQLLNDNTRTQQQINARFGMLFDNKRESQECRDKLTRLGFILE